MGWTAFGTSVADLIHSIFGWSVSEHGRKEWKKRRALKAKRELAHQLLEKNDWKGLRRAITALKRESRQP